MVAMDARTMCIARYCYRKSSLRPSLRPSVRPSVCLSVSLMYRGLKRPRVQFESNYTNSQWFPEEVYDDSGVVDTRLLGHNKQESRAVARKLRDAAAVLFGLKFAENIHYKSKSSQASKARLQSSNIPAQNRI